MASVTLSGGLEEVFEKDIEALLREQHHHHHYQSRPSFDRETDLNVYRSGSAPPTVEGSRNAIGSLFGRPEVRPFDGQNSVDDLSDEDMRSQLAYMSYYYSNENLNPRLPPPLLSKEDWRVAQRFGSGVSALGGIGDRRGRREAVEGEGSSQSLFSLQPGLSVLDEKEAMEHGGGGEWFERGLDGFIRLPETGLGSRRKSFADVLQEDLNHSTTSANGNLSAFDKSSSPAPLSSVHLTQLHNDIGTLNAIRSGRTSPGLDRIQSMSSKVSQSFASAVDPSLVRSRTQDPLIISRSSSPCLPAVGSRASDVNQKKVSNGFGGVSSHVADYLDMETNLAGLNLSRKTGTRENSIQNQYQYQSNPYSTSSIPGLASNEFSKNAGNGILKDDIYSYASNGQINLQRSLSSNNSKKVSTVRKSGFAGSGGHYQTDSLNTDFTEVNPNAYLLNYGLPSMLNNQLDPGSAAIVGGSEYVDMHGRPEGSGYPVSVMDPLYVQYQQKASGSTSFSGNLNDPSLGGNFFDSSRMDLTGFQRAYIEAVLAQQKLQYGGSLSKGSGFNDGFYGTSGLGLGMAYPVSPLSGSLFTSLGSRSPVRQSDRLSRLPSVLRSGLGTPKGAWNYEGGIIDESFASTLLEEFKNNKTRSFDLSDIVSHVVEFSADQYGSRFIQQKLETASAEEKNKIFPEILPHARALMTDVFGNYVIQKFFEHGTESQRNQLASQVIGHILPLSLQMYGCRVIQKALEVVDVEQQTQMVSELDGSVMKCVRDQNGNHVIQKCIECVPQEKIQFIISAFYGQVVSLSSHPYGCRVIQRVLEHCSDEHTESIMMDEILQSVCTLAEDQYGNYVVQHVLQHGKPTERSAIIKKLLGQIVRMSQQKFASNVVEKCLTYGKPEERLLLIKEMLGPNEENEPLQAMMKDQFGNYVVQKVLETCDDQNRELILSRIKVHLNALKRYTYGKHIVARVEKLIATGERRMGMTPSF
ncbi:hypothetical protein KSP39_PZI004841 [Platanthera zijinensis]|uniref:PUM-HD domain-containing protein n=1 Tax=Platanthera zijinensis TaxID=2320716 RepID=A0AAP0GBR8_9ASPA